jgi:predicted DNA-binding ribbon-helix-helix protein
MERASSANGGRVKSTLKRSIMAGARKFSVSLEDEFWDAFKQIAAARNTRLAELVTAINTERQHPNLSSAIRVFVLDHYRALAERRTDCHATALTALHGARPTRRSRSSKC